MTKKYIIELTDDERKQLLEITQKGKTSARKVKRAHVLLLANEGKTDEVIAEVLHVGAATVERIRKRLVLEGFESALKERPRLGRVRKLDAKGEVILETLAKSQPPAGRKRWSMQLLADRLVELKVVASISDEVVRKLVKKSGSSRG
jgi:transposase